MKIQKLKVLFARFLSAVVICSFASCGGENRNSSPDRGNVKQSQKSNEPSTKKEKEAEKESLQGVYGDCIYDKYPGKIRVVAIEDIDFDPISRTNELSLQIDFFPDNPADAAFKGKSEMKNFSIQVEDLGNFDRLVDIQKECLEENGITLGSFHKVA